MVQAHHHAQRRSSSHIPRIITHPLPLMQRPDLLLHVGLQLVKVFWFELGEPPQVVKSSYGADEVAVADVGQRLEMGGGATGDFPS